MTDMQKQKIQWLCRARYAEQLAQALKAAQKRDMLLIQSLGEYHGCEEIQKHLQNIQQETQKKLIELTAIREETAQVIEKVQDMQLKALLIRKYLDYQTTQQIADAFYYDVRTIQRKHKKALDLLEILCF